MKNRPIPYLRIIWCFILSIVFLLLLYFFLRNIIVNHFVEKKINIFNLKYSSELRISSISLTGLCNIKISNASLNRKGSDTLFKVEKITGEISFLKLLAGNVQFTEIHFYNFYVKLFKNHNVNNYLFLLNKTSSQISDIDKRCNYSEQVQIIINKFFDKLPSIIEFQKFNLFIDLNQDRFSFSIPDFYLKDNLFKSNINIVDNDKPESWVLEGNINGYKRYSNFKLYSCNNKIHMPYFFHTLNTMMQFDTLQFSLSNNNSVNDITNLNGIASFDSLKIYNKKLASKDIILNKLKINYSLNIGNDYFELDSLSNITFNKMSFNPYIKYKSKPVKQINLNLSKENFDAQALFESLPAGLFNNFEGIKTEGKLSYKLNFFVDYSKLDSIIFESDIRKNNFHIIKFGNTDFTCFNKAFSHTVFENTIPVREINVSPENPDFIPIEEIPGYLKGAILTSEDGIFYYHNGFIADAFKKSIADNIRAGNFVRGGSTISMQLIKNLFLTKNKSIARKLEEILIVWLIESNGLSSKDRMFEVYLNIIEFGPKIYGVSEASIFYFNKPVKAISLAEAIFLASIVPRPKWFKYEFNEDGSFKDYIINYYQDVSKKMLDKNLISQRDYDNLIPGVILKGNAKFSIINTDSIPADSLINYNKDME